MATFHRSGGGPAFTLDLAAASPTRTQLDVAAAVSATAASTIERERAGLEPEVLFNGFETERFAAIPREREDETTLVTVGPPRRAQGDRVRDPRGARAQREVVDRRGA